MKNPNSNFIDFGTALGREEMRKLMAGSEGGGGGCSIDCPDKCVEIKCVDPSNCYYHGGDPETMFCNDTEVTCATHAPEESECPSEPFLIVSA